jgi:hypothetical protein
MAVTEKEDRCQTFGAEVVVFSRNKEKGEA